jgi:hypothetical protein
VQVGGIEGLWGRWRLRLKGLERTRSFHRFPRWTRRRFNGLPPRDDPDSERVSTVAFGGGGVTAADVMEHTEAFDHVGILANELPGQTGLLFLSSSNHVHSCFDWDRLRCRTGLVTFLTVPRETKIAGEFRSFFSFLYHELGVAGRRTILDLAPSGEDRGGTPGWDMERARGHHENAGIDRGDQLRKDEQLRAGIHGPWLHRYPCPFD